MIKKVTESRAKYDDIANGFLDKHLIVKQLDEVVSCQPPWYASHQIEGNVGDQ